MLAVVQEILTSLLNAAKCTSYYNSSSVCLSVCLFVCSPTPSMSFDGSSPNLVDVCRWTSELPLTGQRVNGSNVTFSEQTTPGWDHTAAKGTPSFACPAKGARRLRVLIPSTGIITSRFNNSKYKRYKMKPTKVFKWENHEFTQRRDASGNKACNIL